MFRRIALRRRLAAAGAPPLADNQLRALMRALDAGPTGTNCVPAGDTASQLRLAVVRTFRFPDLRDTTELKRQPICNDQLCCNPYHWSRICKPDSPPPPYSRFAMEGEVKPKDHEESTKDARRTDHERLVTGSIATDGEERQSWDSEWCRLAYWELTKRVGPQFGVRVRAVDVFGGGGGTCGSGRDGLCLDAFEQRGDAAQAEQVDKLLFTRTKRAISSFLGRINNSPAQQKAMEHEQSDFMLPPEVRKTKAKIGLGVTLSLESDGVWLYNRSEEPVFVSSPALDAAAAKALLVWRVAPGHCLCIFDPACPPPALSLPHIGPVDPRSVRISFAKGWGPKYSRRDVTACPCWLEVLLPPPS